MTRVGTLLDSFGRPEQRVQIIRKGKTTTRIRHSTDHGRSWSSQEDKVDSGLILDDGGELWEKHSHNPKHATYLDLSGKPAARLRVQRPYKNTVKAQFYLGDDRWSEVENVHPSQVVYDGGSSAGWTPLDLHIPDQEPQTTQEHTQPNPQPKSQAPQQEQTTPGQRVAYLRVSSTDQNVTRQREAIGVADREFVDKISARSRNNRQGLSDCMDYLRSGDTLLVASIDRLARSLVDLKDLINQITDKGARVRFIKENLEFSADNTDPRATLMLGVLGSFAEFERSIIRERQAEGIALAKKAGKYKGRKRALTPEDVKKAHVRVTAGESKVAIAKDLNVSRATLYRALADHE